MCEVVKFGYVRNNGLLEYPRAVAEKLTEQFVLTELAGKDFIRSLYYWTSDAMAEVDFVFADKLDIYPVEVNSGENLHARSLRIYRERYSPRLAIRASLSNLRLDDGLLNVPLFGLFNLEGYLQQ